MRDISLHYAGLVLKCLINILLRLDLLYGSTNELR